MCNVTSISRFVTSCKPIPREPTLASGVITLTLPLYRTRTHLEIIVFGQHCNFIAIDTNDLSLEVHQFSLRYLHHVSR